MSFKTLKNICYFAAPFTLVVISVGAWVRLTDAGLGCPDWPGCYGILSTPDTEQELLRAKEFYKLKSLIMYRLIINVIFQRKQMY